MSDTNRIGAACWYRETEFTKWRGGKLRAWSTDHVEFESGPGPFPVGVIEDDEDGMCHSTYVNRICFGTLPPGAQ